MALPAKLIPATLLFATDYEYWSNPDAPDSWEGYPYIWEAHLSVGTQYQSSDSTPTPFEYNGLDIDAGNWICDASGNALRINSVVSKTSNTAVLIIEDVNRFNTLNDPNVSGFGGLSGDFCFIFVLADNGFPNLQGIPVGFVSSEALFKIQSRFDTHNIYSEFVSVYQTNNGFVLGDFIRVDPENEGRYELCSSNEINQAVGIVNSVGNPKTDWFTFRPLTEIVNDVQPPLVGDYGDVFYMDPANPGKVTNIKPTTNAKPVYIRLENEHRAVRLNAIVDTDTIVGTLKLETVTQDQTMFVMPVGTTDVIDMSINGIENKNFTYDIETRTLIFDPVATGYGLDSDDQVIFTYETQK